MVVVSPDSSAIAKALSDSLDVRSLAALADSLVRQSIAFHDSVRAASTPQQSWFNTLVDQSWFKISWPILVSVLGYWFVTRHRRREKAVDRDQSLADKHLEKEAERKALRRAIADELRVFLDIAASQITPLVERLGTEPALTTDRPSEYSPAEYPLKHLKTFESLRGKLSSLGEPVLVGDISKLHQSATHSLEEVIDYKTMTPGAYVKKHAAAGGENLLAFRYEAIRAALFADADDARELAEKLKVIANE